LLLRGQLREVHARAGALHDDPALGDLEVADVRLEQVGRALLGDLHQLARRLVHRDAAGLQAPRAHRARTARDQVGVAVLDGDLLDRDAEVLAREHGPRRRVALAVRGGPGEHGDRPVRVHLDRGVLAELAAAGDLHVRGHADAQLHDVAALAPAGLLGPQLGVPG